MPRGPRRAAVRDAALLALLIAGCSSVPLRDHTLIPTAHRIDVGPYVVHSNFPLPSDAPAVIELARLRRQVESTLGTPIDPGPGSIEVYILDDSRAFAHFLNTYYNELPHRRAFFLAQGERRVIYTFLGDRLTEDLRHEATHALLHCLVADMPLWLDEGLAEYFEDDGPSPGSNPEHLDRLADELRRWRPDLARLECIRDVRSMSPRDYREAWAWVHFLASDSPARRAMLAGYLAELRSVGADRAQPLSERLSSDLDDPSRALVAHVRALVGGTLAARPREPAQTVRLQSHGRPEPTGPTPANREPSAPPRRVGLLGELARGLVRAFLPRR